ncbi:hypothetical protein CTAYLR_005681 [Chrysophaeum taylorii]|uniref:SnoaL-like domain-containing protein n=1 Tax=Chrysophaeum taylorii TaxID=2483200 RepID=A0AAD7XQA8_9STRA|nr:hypothetical protein CTAYLR_005681 [Chrysophaeum taylorii]
MHGRRRQRRRRRVLLLFFAGSSALAPDVSQRIRALQEQQRTIADELASLQVVTPRTQILRLYEAFNARDLEGVASLLADDVVYEDLLLGDTTICRGKEAFKAALAWHPAFVSARLDLPLGSLELVVDKVACDGDTTVAVEWHVEQNGRPFPLGRGLSIATLDDDKNLSRVVDLCEAPWRVVGLLVRPVLSFFGAASALATFLAVNIAVFSSYPPGTFMWW